MNKQKTPLDEKIIKGLSNREQIRFEQGREYERTVFSEAVKKLIKRQVWITSEDGNHLIVNVEDIEKIFGKLAEEDLKNE